jgi:hypothetical protein
MHRALAALFLFALAFVGYARESECHEGHCHGDKVCGGGWKDYPEARTHVGPEGGVDSESDACPEALDELEDRLDVEAHGRCEDKHPCGSCPDACSGCKQQSPEGRIVDPSAVKKHARERDDGLYECVVTADVAFRCRCSDCKK